MIGSTLDGKYRIIRQLGAGAMGAVYEAEHTGTGRKVAVKVITGQLAQDPGLVSRFQREARAAGAIDTKHITQVLDTGIDRDSELPFMVMEFLSGQDLQQFLKKSGPIAPDLALRIVAQSCLGLQKAHEAGVVHRDIKPANLFLARSDGEVIVKVLDFGIAKVQMDQAQETESACLTRTGNMLGSPLYMSPEQARGSKNIDHRADLWSLGAALYSAAARFRGDLVQSPRRRAAPSVVRHPWAHHGPRSARGRAARSVLRGRGRRTASSAAASSPKRSSS